MAVQVCLRRDGELMALKISRLFEKEFPGYFDDEDRAFQVRLRENIDKLQLAIAKHTALLAQPVPELSAYNNRGYTRILLGNYKQAISDFDRAIEVGSAEAYAYNNRGFAYLRLGQLSKALADIKHSLQLDPDNAYAHRNLGIYYYEQGDWQSALTNLEQSAQLGPNTPDLQGYLKLVKAHLA